jgi:hypothetical protein
MGTLKGFPNPPALWLRWAKPSYAYAFASPHDIHPGSILVRNAG